MERLEDAALRLLQRLDARVARERNFGMRHAAAGATAGGANRAPYASPALLIADNDNIHGRTPYGLGRPL